MTQAFRCDAVQAPIGRFGGRLPPVRADPTVAKAEPLERNPRLDLHAIGDVLLGCTDDADEDNRNIARMTSLLAGLPVHVSRATINPCCASAAEAVGTAWRAVVAGDIGLVILGRAENIQ